MIDDLTCFRLAEDCFWLFPAPSRCAQAMAAVERVTKGHNATVTNLGYKNAYISVQGPNSRALLQKLTATDLSNAGLPYFSLNHGTVADVPDVLISRTGYSGELGYELFYPSEYAAHMLRTLLETGRPLGAQLCGLGALRSLRIEMRGSPVRLRVAAPFR
jgi:aminomethyltransferase